MSESSINERVLTVPLSIDREILENFMSFQCGINKKRLNSHFTH